MARDILPEIEQFAQDISDLWKYEALDGDQTEAIARQVLVKLDAMNGNV